MLVLLTASLHFFQKKNHFPVTLTKFNFLLESVPGFSFAQWLTEYFQRLNINLFKNRKEAFWCGKKKTKEKAKVTCHLVIHVERDLAYKRILLSAE